MPQTSIDDEIIRHGAGQPHDEGTERQTRDPDAEDETFEEDEDEFEDDDADEDETEDEADDREP